MVRDRFVAAGLVLGVVAAAGYYYAASLPQKATAASGVNTAENGLALGGFDATSYRGGLKAEPGSRRIVSEIDGVEYRFASSDAKAKFDADPAAFLPEYGGYCAYGVRMGKRLPIDPEAWAVVDDRLFVFLDRATQQRWEEEREVNIAIADRLWVDLIKTP